MAYEKVTPADKGGGQIWPGSQTIHASATGDRVAYKAPIAFPGATGSAYPSDYLAVASGGQWTTQPLTPPLALDPAGADTSQRYGYNAFSRDLRRGVLVHRDPALVPDAAEHVLSAYVSELGPQPHGYRLLTRPLALPPIPAFLYLSMFSPAIGWVSPTADRVVFESALPLTADAPTFGQIGVYEWADGDVRLVSKLPSGETPTATAALGRGSQPGGSRQSQLDRAVSADGSRIIFTVSDGAGFGAFGAAVVGDVYVRIDGRATVEASASQRAVPDDPAPAAYLTAARDGSVVFLASCEKLTDDATASCTAPMKIDVYRYDVDTGELEDLTAAADAPRFEGVIGADEAGETLYFGGQDGRIHVWHAGSLTTIPATSYRGTIIAGLNWGGGLVGNQSAVSADGRFLVFQSVISASPNVRDLYLYDRDTEAVRCISCMPDGSPSVGVSVLHPYTAEDTDGGPTSGVSLASLQRPRNIDDHGRYVFFQTVNPLVPEDTNGRADVYRYEIATGHVELISTGKGAFPAFFGDASADGDVVFFSTANRVIEALDHDGFIDLYAARVGATPYSPPLEPGGCVGADCQGPLPEQEPPEAPGTATYRGPGDVREGAQGARVRVLRLIPLTAGQRRQLARRGRTTVGIVASDAGQIAVTVHARLGTRLRTVGRASRTLGAGGTVRVGIRLSRPARVHLARRGALPLRITATYVRPRGGGASERLTVRTTRRSRR